MNEEVSRVTNVDDSQPSSSKVNLISDRDNLLEVDHEEAVKTEDNSAVGCTYIMHEFISKGTQVDQEHKYGFMNRYKDDNATIKFYTGFESYKKLNLVYSALSPVVHKIKYYGSNVIILSSDSNSNLLVGAIPGSLLLYCSQAFAGLISDQ